MKEQQVLSGTFAEAINKVLKIRLACVFTLYTTR